MSITGGFGTFIDLVTGRPRSWYMRADGIKRWVSNDQPCDASHLLPLLQDCLDFALDVPECGCAHSKVCSRCERRREAQRLAERLVDAMR